MSASIGRLIDLPKIADPKGNLTFIEARRHIPFAIERVYYTYDVPGGEIRGGHAHLACEEFIVAASGSFDVILEDGPGSRQRLPLNRSYYGLYVPPMTWRELENFSTGSVCLVLASAAYDEGDYVRDHEAFVDLVTRSER